MGSGYKTFTAGAVLTASDVQNYLQDQSVMVFGGTAARSSAIGTANFEEGMLTYLTDVDKLQVYTGAAFADVYPATTGTPMGTLINTTSFSGVSAHAVDDVFSSTYTNYLITVNITAVGTGDVTLRLNFRTTGGVDVTTNMSTQRISFYTSVVGATISSGTFGASSSSYPTYSNYVLNVANPNLNSVTTYNSAGGYVNNSGQPFIDTFYGYNGAANVFTGIKIIPSASTISGTMSIYGVNK